MNVKSSKTIAICASAAHFKNALEISDQLKNLGFKVKIPKTAGVMQKNNDFDVSHYKTWYKDDNDYNKKTELIKGHFKKIIDSDAILVTNYEKNGIEGYIGGNTLMEMAIAFIYLKTIFILNPIDEKLGFKEEVYGLRSIFLNGNLESIKKILK